MASNDNFDLVIIGCGPAGEKAGAQAAYFGKRVAIIERAPSLGGVPGCRAPWAAEGDERHALAEQPLGAPVAGVGVGEHEGVQVIFAEQGLGANDDDLAVPRIEIACSMA